VKAVLGLIPYTGTILLNGQPIDRLMTSGRARRGIGFVPEGRGIFGPLTVRENLLMGAHIAPRGEREERLEEVLSVFPPLRHRLDQLGSSLSGGQQQMLSVGRALMANPSLILLDEPTEGLAPVIIDQLADVFNRIAAQGTALLMIEQNMSLVVRVCHRYLAMAKGSVVADGLVQNTRASLEELEGHVTV